MDGRWLTYTVSEFILSSGSETGSIIVIRKAPAPGHSLRSGTRQQSLLQELLTVKLTSPLGHGAGDESEAGSRTRRACEELLRNAGGWIERPEQADGPFSVSFQLPIHSKSVAV